MKNFSVIKMNYPVLILFCCLFVSVDAQAQSVAKRLDSLYNSLASKKEFNGNVLVSDKNKIVYTRSFGYADQEHRLLNTEQTAFHLASVTKTFTAVAILQLEQKKLLNLDDTYIKYFPNFPWPAITIRQLLSHTSGIQDYQIFEQPHHANPNQIFTIYDLIPALTVGRKGLLSKPGEKYSYSNTGFGLLALLTEKLTGMKFQAYLVQYIFRPAGMSHTYIQSALLPVTDRMRAKRYEFTSYAPDELKPIDSVKRDHIQSVILGAILGPSNIVTTTGDMFNFDQALYSNKLVNQRILAEAFKPIVLTDGKKAETGWANTKSYYGLGWMILQDTTYGKVVWHSGGAPGMVTVFLRNISNHQSVVVLDNVTHTELHPQGVNAFYILNSGPIYTGKASLARTYVIALHQKGADAGAATFNLNKADTANFYMRESELNGFAYDLLRDGFKTEALEAFKLNTLLYPESFNTYDSYADVLAVTGKKDKAIEMYEKSMSLNPNNENGKKALEELKKP